MERNRLARKLGLLEAVSIGIGGMIGGAIFEVIGLVAGMVGPSIFLSFSFAATIAALIGYSYSKLGPTFPESGGSFTYIHKALRGRALSVFVGYMLWFSYSAACALYSVGFAFYLSFFIKDVPPIFTPFLLILVFVLLNLRGVKEAGIIQSILVTIKVLSLVFLIVVGLRALNLDNFYPMFPNGFWAPLLGSAILFIGYQGFDIIGTSAEELKDPKRTIPKAIYLSIIIVAFLYIFVSIVSVGVVNYQELGAARAPLILVAERSFGITGMWILATGGVISTGSAFNAALYGASRIAYNLSYYNIMPKSMMKLNKSKAPYISVLSAGALTTVITVAGLTSEETVKFLSSLSSASFLLIFFLVTISNYKLRYLTKSNVKILKVAIVLCLFAMALLAFADPTSWVVVLSWIALSITVDKFLKWKMSKLYYHRKD